MIFSRRKDNIEQRLEQLETIECQKSCEHEILDFKRNDLGAMFLYGGGAFHAVCTLCEKQFFTTPERSRKIEKYLNNQFIKEGKKDENK